MTPKGATSDAQPAPTAPLGPYLATLRDSKGLTLRDVEEAAEGNVSNAYLSQLENGRVRKPSPHILHALARVYGIPYETLMEKAGYISADNSAKGSRRRSARTGRLALLASAEPTTDEEEELLEYLTFLRKRKKPTVDPS